MANSRDIALFKNDLYISGGDIQIAESDEQHVSDTISAFPGWYKQFPSDGVGILQYINSTGQEQTIERSIKIQLQSDGYRMSNAGITIIDGMLTINPNAEKL